MNRPSLLVNCLETPLRMYLGYDFNPELDDLKLKYPGDKGSDSQAIV